jgi:uncharacterized protein YjbI with pentapeptide repeats
MMDRKNVCSRNVDFGVNRLLLVLVYVLCQLIARGSAALPEVVFTGHFTDRFAPHSIPGWPQGDFVQIGVVLETADPAGSPMIVVNAKQDDTTLTLDWYSLPSTIYPSPHLYYKFIELDPALTGPWQITATDSTGVGPPIFSSAIAAPEFLPVVENIRVGGSPLGTTVEWSLPNFAGFDVEWTQVRVIQVSPLAEVFQSQFLPAITTSFNLAPGILQPGVEYVYSINLTDFEGANRENRSGALSETFRYTIAGDHNGDGTVDAADYVVWRKGLGTTHAQDEYKDWRSNFGSTIGNGSGLTGDPRWQFSVPEPATFVLWSLAFGVLLVLRRSKRVPHLAAASLTLILCANTARADIFQWEYINPGDPRQGKQQSATLAPDGAGVDAVPGANLSNRDLTMAYLNGARLSDTVFFCYFGVCQTYTTAANLNGTILTNADLSNADLTAVTLWGTNLTGADFTNAVVSRIRFDSAVSRGFTAAQLNSTANYQAHDLAGIGLGENDLSGWNFSGQYLLGAYFGHATLTACNFSGANLTNSGFWETTLTGADFTGAEVSGASFSTYDGSGTGITLAQLYSTASYQNRDLSRIGLTDNNLAGSNFADQDLTYASLMNADLRQADLSDANLFGANLTDADITGANVRGANFGRYIDRYYGSPPAGSGITLTQLYSSASYQVHDLSGINVQENNLAGANFAGQNLINADFSGAALTGADFTSAEIRGANFSTRFVSNGRAYAGGTGITLSQLYSTASYQAHDLSGIQLYQNNLAGGNFADQNLSNAQLGDNLAGASFRGANLTKAIVIGTLTDADFTGADIRGAQIFSVVTLSQLYSTASYQARDLNGILLRGNLSGGNFDGQNLSNARLDLATLTDADLTGAEVRGASFGYPGITLAQLYSTASYQARDLTGISLCCDLSGANFVGQNLSNAKLPGTLMGADFTDADVRGASIFQISLAQLYSTASYRKRDLSGVQLTDADLAGADFEQQNLKNANLGGAMLSGVNFRGANLTNTQYRAYSGGCPNSLNSSCGYVATLSGADLTAADARGALDLSAADAETANLIWPDGHINGLDLEVGGLLVVRDYDGDFRYELALPPIPISIDQHMETGPGGTLRMVLEADEWDSTISFAPGIPVTLGGTLELTFADDVNLASQIGRTFDLFNWTDVTPTGAFAISSPYVWDLSNLYTTGEVTLAAVPEPLTLTLALVAGACTPYICRPRMAAKNR